MQEIRMWPFLAPRRSYQHMAVPRGATARAFAGERSADGLQCFSGLPPSTVSWGAALMLTYLSSREGRLRTDRWEHPPTVLHVLLNHSRRDMKSVRRMIRGMHLGYSAGF